MIKAIILDLWDTIIYNKEGYGTFIERINEIIGIENKDKFSKLRSEWYISRISEEQFFTKLLNEVNKPLAMLDHMIAIWDGQLEAAVLYPETMFVLQTLKGRGVKLVLVSNTVPIGERVVKKLGLEKYFDLVFLSFQEGIKKPSPFVYKKILDRLNLKPEEVIAVGDKLETDILGAETYGIKVILIDRTNKKDYKNKILDLEELEFYLK